MENYNFDLGINQPLARKKGRVLKVVGVLASLVVVAGLLVYSGGMESVLKLLGVGASGIYDITISSNRQFIGDAAFFVTGSEPVMDGVSVFTNFSGTPADPNPDEQGAGFVAPIFSSPQDPSKETYLDHSYTSAIADLTIDAPLLSAIEITDAAPANAAIAYNYRTAATSEGISAAGWEPLDPSVVNQAIDGVRVRTGVVEQIVGRYAQIRVTFTDADPMQRPAVYAISFQYKDSSDAGGSAVPSEGATEKEVSLRYEAINAPVSADVDVLSADLSNQVVYSEKGINFSERLSYTFTTALAQGAYAVAVSSPTIETVIVPFEVGAADTVSVNLGSFAPPSGQNSSYDLNGDGVVNSLDLAILMSKFTP